MPRTAAAILAVAVVLGACGSSIPVVSFDPSSRRAPTEGQQPGAYPELEALLPTTYQGKAPDNVDSGRNCTPAALGHARRRRHRRGPVRGRHLGPGGTSGLTVAVFRARAWMPTPMLEFYEASAEHRPPHREARRRSDDDRRRRRGPSGWTSCGSDGAGQTIVTWQPADDGPVWVLLAADIGDTKVDGGPGDPRATLTAGTGC